MFETIVFLKANRELWGLPEVSEAIKHAKIKKVPALEQFSNQMHQDAFMNEWEQKKQPNIWKLAAGEEK